MEPFLEAVRNKLRAMPPSRRAKWKPTIKGRQWKYPLASEADLLRLIRRTLAPITKIYHEALAKSLGPIPNTFTKGIYRRVQDAVDPWAGDIGWGASMRLLLQHQKELAEEGKARQGLISGVMRVGRGVDRFNATEWNEIASQSLGEAYSQEDPWAVDAIVQWQNTGVTKITNLSEQYIQKLDATIQTAVKQGWTAKKVMQELRNADQTMTVSRAKLIARDQVGTLNGLLTKTRMSTAGIRMYQWGTGMDERVRGNPSGLYPQAIPSHWLMQGWICRWDDNTVRSKDGEHWEKRPMDAPVAIPGEEIQCRCTAIPYFGKAIEDLVPGMQFHEFDV